MANSQQLTRLLEQSGMPNGEWWEEAESAYHDMCQILTEDINKEELSNRAGRPLIVILPTGNHACKLSSRSELLKCVAFGTLRADLFVEVVWQNITRAQGKGSKLKAYEVSEKRSILSFSGFIFNLHYIESPELVRSFPAIVDVPRAVQAELQDEADENVEAIRDLKLITDQTEKYPFFSQIYYFLRAWMISSGLYQIDSGGQSLRLLRKRVASFDGELLRELSWSILLNNNNQNSHGNVSAKISDYLLHHTACLKSSKKDGCSFYHDSEGPFARHWSDNQFRTVHEEFLTLYTALTGGDGQQLAESLTSDQLCDTLQLLFSKPLFDKLKFHSYIRVTVHYSGQSQIAGTRMMQFVEERVLDLIEALENLTEGMRLRPWPTKLVDVHTREDDHPYEGYWLIGAAVDETATQTVIESVLSRWNDKVCTSHRYSATTMVIHAELISQKTMFQQNLKEDLREWPLPLAKPDPRYTAEDITKEAPKGADSTPPNGSQSSRKLRPAMDVLSRLKHDPSFNLDDYVVGYTDRHAGIQEKAAGMWISESTDEEWIPQGRIQYFRRISDGKRVWDRATKYDCVFN